MARRLSAGSIASLVVLLLLAGVATFSSLKHKDAVMADSPLWPAFDLQGHRGARGLMPENSLPGFEAALVPHAASSWFGLTQPAVTILAYRSSFTVSWSF